MGDGADCGEYRLADVIGSETVSDLLANRRRRYALYCLYVCTNPLTLPDIAQQVTEWEHNRPTEEILDARLRVYMSLYHDHVPKLEDANLVVYHQGDDMIELTETAASLAPPVEQLARAEIDEGYVACGDA